MAILLQPENKPVLTWLLEKDPTPSAVPVFPEGNDLGLVMAYLLNGVCYAEFLTGPYQLKQICGSGFPFGRLFFHIKRQDLQQVCDRLED